MADAVSGVFLLEQAASLTVLDNVVAEIEDISLLISSTVGKMALKGDKVPRLRTLREIRHMLQERVARWPEQWLKQGRQLGKTDLLKALAKTPLRRASAIGRGAD